MGTKLCGVDIPLEWSVTTSLIWALVVSLPLNDINNAICLKLWSRFFFFCFGAPWETVCMRKAREIKTVQYALTH